MNLMPATSIATEKTINCQEQNFGSPAILGPSWRSNVAEEARTRGFASPAFAGFAFVARVIMDPRK
jgi:hypothetical protein